MFAIEKLWEIDRSRKTILVLRTCKADMSTQYGFVWPETGYVEAADWKPTAECGNGLHGWAKGVGDISLGYMGEDGYKALVVETYADHVIDLGGKVKFPFGWVVFCGDIQSAALIIKARHPDMPVMYSTATAGDGGTATAGYDGIATAGHDGIATAGHDGIATAGHDGTATAGHDGTATAGDRGTATAGYDGIATAGHDGTATAGHGGTATAGHDGTATAGDRGTATAGHDGTATAGHDGTATAGDRGTATAGDRGTATAGDGGTATAGDRGTATAGYGGVIIIQRWNGKRYKFEYADVGDGGLKPNVAYHLNDDGKFVEATE